MTEAHARRPRWRTLVWQGAVLIIIGLVAAGIGDGPLGLAIAALGGLLLLAGLIGASVTDARPK